MAQHSSSDLSLASDLQTMDAVALLRANRLQDAVVAYQAVLQRNPDDSYALSNYGGPLCTLGESHAPQELLARAVRLKPGMAEAWSDSGDVLYVTHDYCAASHAF